MPKKKIIKGIQITALEIDGLTGSERDVYYCKGFEEMTIDFTDGSNMVINAAKLEKMITGVRKEEVK